MAEVVIPPRMSEPVIVPCHFIEGFRIEMRDDFVRIVGYIDLEVIEEGMAPERRIIVRAAMPLIVARALAVDLRKVTVRGNQ